MLEFRFKFRAPSSLAYPHAGSQGRPSPGKLAMSSLSPMDRLSIKYKEPVYADKSDESDKGLA